MKALGACPKYRRIYICTFAYTHASTYARVHSITFTDSSAVTRSRYVRSVHDLSASVGERVFRQGSTCIWLYILNGNIGDSYSRHVAMNHFSFVAIIITTALISAVPEVPHRRCHRNSESVSTSSKGKNHDFENRFCIARVYKWCLNQILLWLQAFYCILSIICVMYTRARIYIFIFFVEKILQLLNFISILIDNYQLRDFKIEKKIKLFWDFKISRK